MKISKLLSALLIVTLAISSCNTGNDDTNSPSITSAQVNGLTSFSEIQVLAGNNIVVTANISEDVELDSYRIQVMADFTSANSNVFSYDQTVSAGGLSATVNETITIPATATAGPYIVKITATDAAGRESETSITVLITSPTQAEINLSAPADNLVMSFGDTIFLAGTITDDVDLVTISLKGEPVQMAGGLSAAGGVFYESNFNLNGASDTSWDFSEVQTNNAYAILPTTGSTGNYELEIRALDSDDNVTVKSIPFSIF